MQKLRKMNERHQITIPASVLREARAPEGALFSVVADNGRIILEPKRLEDGLGREDWASLDRLVAKQRQAGAYKDYADPKKAKRHLR